MDKPETGRPYPPDQLAAREMTMDEYLDRAIQHAQRRAAALTELKRSLSQDYLSRGCSPLAIALKLDA